MIRKIALLCACAFALMNAKAQPTLSSEQMVGISPMLSSELKLPEDAKRSLGMKLMQMVTQNGMGSFSGQFILTSNVVVIDKQATATAPIQYVTELEVSVFLLDVVEQTIVDEMSFQVKGIDRLENKAMIQAINQIKPRANNVRAFMNNCREKIIEYYNTRIPTLLTKAQSLAERNEYEEAIAVLSAIPENVDQYPVVADQMAAIYIKMLDRDATAAIQEAKGQMALRNYEGAIEAVMMVDPSSSLAPQAYAIIDQIKGSIDAKEQQEMEERLKVYNDQKEAAQRLHDDKVALTKMQIQAAQKVGEAQAQKDNSTSEKVNNWFKGKFGSK